MIRSRWIVLALVAVLAVAYVYRQAIVLCEGALDARFREKVAEHDWRGVDSDEWLVRFYREAAAEVPLRRDSRTSQYEIRETMR